MNITHRSYYLLFFCLFLFFAISPRQSWSQSSDSLSIVSHHQEALAFFKQKDYVNAILQWKITLDKKIVFYGHDHSEVAKTYYNIGSMYNSLELFEEAKENFKAALTIRLLLTDYEKEKLSTNIIRNYKFLGKALKETGDYDQALLLYDSCLEKIDSNHPEYPGILKFKAQTLKYKKGKYLDDAIELYQEVAAIFRKRKEAHELAKVLNDLGNAYDEKKDYQKALHAYKEAFPILKNINNYDITYNSIVKVSSNLGAAYTKVDDFKQAEKILLQSLKISKEVHKNIPFISHYAQIHDHLGELYFIQKEYQKSLSQFDLALNNIIVDFEKIKNKLDITSIDSITFIGLKYDAIEILFSRAKCLNGSGKKEAALENYHFLHQVILALRKDIETESSRLVWATNTRAIYSHAAKLSLELKQNEEAFDFIEKSKSVLLFENLLRAKSDRISNLPDSTKMQLNLVKKEINTLKRDLVYSILDKEDSISSQLRDELFLTSRKLEKLENKNNKNNKNFNLNTLHYSLSDFQNYLKENKSIAIEFFGTTDELMALVIQANNITPYSFPKDALLKKEIKEWINLISNANHSKSSLEKSHLLSASIYKKLITPLQLPEGEKLLIIPDGILQFIPFEALLASPFNAQEKADYFLHHHPIHYAYSASVQMQLNDFHSKAIHQALIVSPQQFEDLPELQSFESQKIKKILKAELIEKENATASRFMDMASKYELLHLSTHAAPAVGELSQPWIAFHDRKLKLPELYTMNLNAQLVTLSACETAKGELIEGEGVMSLARGFSFAGVPQVITSLWEVNENSTAKIMESFYTHIQTGKTPSEALHLSKINYLDSHSLSDANPYYWAAFTALGHDSYNAPSKENIWFWLVLGMIGLLSVFMFFGKKGK